MATFVLVHGAWHGGWCWEEIVSRLKANGHRVLAPDLPGMGSDKTEFSKNPLGDWADFVASVIREEINPVILVGHSRGGIVISEVAERVPERVTKLVYLTAMLASDGQTLFELAGTSPDEPNPMIQFSENGLTCTVAPEFVQPVFYNQCSADVVAEVSTKLCPEPVAAFATPVRITTEKYGSVPRAFIEAEDDNIIPLALQRAMQAALPCDPVIALKSDHSPFLSMPDQLAKALESLAED